MREGARCLRPLIYLMFPPFFMLPCIHPPDRSLCSLVNPAVVSNGSPLPLLLGNLSARDEWPSRRHTPTIQVRKSLKERSIILALVLSPCRWGDAPMCLHACVDESHKSHDDRHPFFRVGCGSSSHRGVYHAG